MPSLPFSQMIQFVRVPVAMRKRKSLQEFCLMRKTHEHKALLLCCDELITRLQNDSYMQHTNVIKL